MKKILLLFSIVVLCVSCEKEENTKTYHGEWFLVGVENPFTNQVSNYEAGQIIWDFDTSNQIIKVTNNTNELVVLTEGFHAYNFSQHACSYLDYDFITAGEIDLGVFDLQSLGDDKIKINYSCVDGEILYLER